jgi:hypothetical protein
LGGNLFINKNEVMEKVITKEKYDKLIDCEYLYNYTEWRKAKFLKRGRSFVSIVVKNLTEDFFIIKKNCRDVRVEGKELLYKDRFSFTNSKSPF